MGGGIALRLASSPDIGLHVFDVREEARTQFQGKAQVATSVADLAAACSVIGIVVANDAQLEDVVLGEGGILTTARPGTHLLIHSTVSANCCTNIAAACAEHGIEVVDAPVTGSATAGRDAALKGSLTVLAGGGEAAIDRCRPVLERYAANIVHTGAIGSAATVKALNQLLALTNLIATHECVRVAQAHGITESAMLSALSVSSGRSGATEQWDWLKTFLTTHPRGAEYYVREILGKDVGLALHLASSAAVPVPVSAAASQRTRWLVNLPESGAYESALDHR
jgi:3-hydroxyisobutyrate dehydrogenase-like beta-hydroxyacid dehydrogenase